MEIEGAFTKSSLSRSPFNVLHNFNKKGRESDKHSLWQDNGQFSAKPDG